MGDLESKPLGDSTDEVIASNAQQNGTRPMLWERPAAAAADIMDLTPDMVVPDDVADEIDITEVSSGELASETRGTVAETVQAKEVAPQPEKKTLEPEALSNMLKKEAWILGGIVSEQRLLEDGSIIAKILIRKELQHWASESQKENTKDMADYTGDDNKSFILALMTKTGEFLKFDIDACTRELGHFNIDEWYNNMDLDTSHPWWKN